MFDKPRIVSTYAYADYCCRPYEIRMVQKSVGRHHIPRWVFSLGDMLIALRILDMILARRPRRCARWVARARPVHTARNSPYSIREEAADLTAGMICMRELKSSKSFYVVVILRQFEAHRNDAIERTIDDSSPFTRGMAHQHVRTLHES